MSELINFLKKNCFHGIGTCTNEVIQDAEKRLDISFPEEYKDFLRYFKAGSFMGMELMGVDTMAYLDTVSNTISERENNDRFPKDCFVLENLGIEGMLTIVDEAGKVYSYCNGKTEKLADSLVGYLNGVIEK